MMRIATGMLVGVAFASLAGCSFGSGAVSPLGCRIALGYIKDFEARAGKPIGVWTRPASSGISSEDIDAFVKDQPQHTDDPEISRFRAQAWVEDLSVVANCRDVRRWLDDERIPHDDARLERLPGKEPWPIAVLAISMPVFTDGGTTASFAVYESWGPLGGSVHAIVYKRGADGRWRLASRDTLGIS